MGHPARRVWDLERRIAPANFRTWRKVHNSDRGYTGWTALGSRVGGTLVLVPRPLDGSLQVSNTLESRFERV